MTFPSGVPYKRGIDGFVWALCCSCFISDDLRKVLKVNFDRHLFSLVFWTATTFTVLGCFLVDLTPIDFLVSRFLKGFIAFDPESTESWECFSLYYIMPENKTRNTWSWHQTKPTLEMKYCLKFHVFMSQNPEYLKKKKKKNPHIAEAILSHNQKTQVRGVIVPVRLTSPQHTYVPVLHTSHNCAVENASIT